MITQQTIVTLCEAVAKALREPQNSPKADTATQEATLDELHQARRLLGQNAHCLGRAAEMLERRREPEMAEECRNQKALSEAFREMLLDKECQTTRCENCKECTCPEES